MKKKKLKRVEFEFYDKDHFNVLWIRENFNYPIHPKIVELTKREAKSLRDFITEWIGEEK